MRIDLKRREQNEKQSNREVVAEGVGQIVTGKMIATNKMPQSADGNSKKLLDLRAFALEYVKQIVQKANELSVLGPQNRLDSQGQNQKSRRAIKEAVSEINQRFKFPAPPITSQVASQMKFPADKNNNNNYNNDDYKHNVHYRDSFGRSDVALDNNNRVATSTTIACDSNMDIQPQASQSRANENVQTQARARDGRGGRRRIRDQLNWHLIVSCFSTCLPSTIVEATVPGGGGGDRSSGGCSGSQVNPM